MHDNCLICKRIAMIQDQTNPYFVAELTTGYVVLGDFQCFRGYTLFLCKHHVSELHHLDHQTKLQYLEEMSAVAQAVYETFQPKKLNYSLLGNSEEHLHWHLFPRHADDPALGKPVWIVDKAVRYADSARPTEAQLHTMKLQLMQKLDEYASLFIIARYDG
ncbi:MAG: HIT family protein [Chloroflexota bacterium]